LLTTKANNLILAASLTLLGTAPAAWAQYPYRTYRSYEYRSMESSRMLQVVHSMDTTAQWMSRMADRNNRRPDDAEAVALDRLHDLSIRARHFEAEVSRYRQDPQHTEDDFQAVVDA